MGRGCPLVTWLSRSVASRPPRFSIFYLSVSALGSPSLKMRTFVWACVCSTSAALVPFEPFGVPRRTSPLGRAGSDTLLPVSSAAAKTLKTFVVFVLTEEQRESTREALAKYTQKAHDEAQEARDRYQKSSEETEASRLRMLQAFDLAFDELRESFWRNIFDRPAPSHKAHQAESPPRAPERQLAHEASQQLSDQLFRGLVPQEQASALEAVGRLEQLSTAERYNEVEAVHQAFNLLDQEFDRLEQSEPPSEGELQAARLLWMRRGEAYELWLDMLEKLHELEGNEEKLRRLKDVRARNLKTYGPRLDARARLERAFLEES